MMSYDESLALKNVCSRGYSECKFQFVDYKYSQISIFGAC